MSQLVASPLSHRTYLCVDKILVTGVQNAREVSARAVAEGLRVVPAPRRLRPLRREPVLVPSVLHPVLSARHTCKTQSKGCRTKRKTTLNTLVSRPELEAC